MSIYSQILVAIVVSCNNDNYTTRCRLRRESRPCTVVLGTASTCDGCAPSHLAQPFACPPDVNLYYYIYIYIAPCSHGYVTVLRLIATPSPSPAIHTDMISVIITHVCSVAGGSDVASRPIRLTCVPVNTGCGCELNPTHTHIHCPRSSIPHTQSCAHTESVERAYG